MSFYTDVRDFHIAFNQLVGEKPELPDELERSLRRKLLKEEFLEYMDAEDKDNIRTSIGSSVLGCLSWTVLISGDAGQKASQQQTATEHMGTF